ncbi:MAG TPA: penicillin acylase family protein, partial [Steroidobacteraceae bacterium]|nr:penicillin acylase family protein [Steroidobacteraceae bacterium]
MQRRHPLLSLAFCLITASVAAGAEPGASECTEAKHTTITRDDWGIAHVHGASDADAVFGAIYAQAEDDFKRVETNYLSALGRLAEAEGSKALYE